MIIIGCLHSNTVTFCLQPHAHRDIRWLEQACTHDLTGAQASYRELAFVGDAALWLLFAEHAFKAYGSLEDPVR